MLCQATCFDYILHTFYQGRSLCQTLTVTSKQQYYARISGDRPTRVRVESLAITRITELALRRPLPVSFHRVALLTTELPD